ncbi:MAG TPA: helix-turn-helix transcriptional regulator [Pseudonocardiaceae bacterium]
MAGTSRVCNRCGARLATDQTGPLCSPCAHTQSTPDEPPSVGAEFWQRSAVSDALRARHFGRLFRAYRQALGPEFTQTTLGRWLGMTQAQVSRLERAQTPPSDLQKLQRWASVLRVPPALLWFAIAHAPAKACGQANPDTLDDVRRRDWLKLTGAAAAVATSSAFTDAPWQRLAETLSGRRAADASTVTMIEARTAGFFRTEETMPARELIISLKAHHRSLRQLVKSTESEDLRRRLISSIGETEALAGWTLFDLQRPQEAIRVYRDALESARQAGDDALGACVLGYWSYLLSSRGDASGAVRMLEGASERVRGSAAATQAWVTARQAEEQAQMGDVNPALRCLDSAITIFDYASPSTERPWTGFFTPSRLGSLAVSTYTRLSHPDTESVASNLLASLAPTENKVKALVLADLAVAAARSGDLDRVQPLANRSAPLAVHTEASLAIDRLWEVVELLPGSSTGTAGQTREQITEQLLGARA